MESKSVTEESQAHENQLFRSLPRDKMVNENFEDLHYRNVEPEFTHIKGCASVVC